MFSRTIRLYNVVASDASTTDGPRPKSFVFDEDDVAGTVRKPQVEYIIARGDTGDTEELQLTESFIPKLLKSVDRKPF